MNYGLCVIVLFAYFESLIIYQSGYDWLEYIIISNACMLIGECQLFEIVKCVTSNWTYKVELLSILAVKFFAFAGVSENM